MKKALILTLIVISLLMVSCSLGQIEDTNGDEDSSLATLTDEDIIHGRSSAAVTSVKTTMNGVTKLSVRKFSGVQTVETIRSGSDTTLRISVRLSSGNLEVVLVKDGKITHRIPVNEDTETVLGQNSKYELTIAGESADFTIEYSK